MLSVSRLELTAIMHLGLHLLCNKLANHQLTGIIFLQATALLLYFVFFRYLARFLETSWNCW